jgi:DNA-binding LacI/PurR family transcriptional regulator
MATMMDVAKRAGVSVATVSNVITGKQVVSKKARTNVIKAIEELSYQVNFMARGLKTQRTYSIAVIIIDITKFFFTEILHGIMETASAQGYNVNIFTTTYDFKRERELVRSLRQSRVDGIILSSCVPVEQSHEWAVELTSGQNTPPIVSLENVIDSELIASVIFDYKQRSYEITQHLIEQGKRKILYCYGLLSLEQEMRRLEGYKEALKDNGIEYSDDLVLHVDYVPKTSYEIIRDTLARGLSFNAIQASSDQAAVGALYALKERGISVPESIAVCGFDNLFPSTMVSPAITTVDTPRFELGSVATRELIRLIEDGSAKPNCFTIESHIVIRESSHSCAKSDWHLGSW